MKPFPSLDTRRCVASVKREMEGNHWRDIGTSLHARPDALYVTLTAQSAAHGARASELLIVPCVWACNSISWPVTESEMTRRH